VSSYGAAPHGIGFDVAVYAHLAISRERMDCPRVRATTRQPHHPASSEHTGPRQEMGAYPTIGNEPWASMINPTITITPPSRVQAVRPRTNCVFHPEHFSGCLYVIASIRFQWLWNAGGRFREGNHLPCQATSDELVGEDVVHGAGETQGRFDIALRRPESENLRRRLER
jgi:hypothetical protein